MKGWTRRLAFGLLVALVLAGCAVTSGAVKEGAQPSAAAGPSEAETDPYAGYKNLALGSPIKANNHIYQFTADKAVDGDVLTYWEGGPNKYPNEVVVDLGAVHTIKAIRIKLNPARIWQPRKQTFEILISDDGENFTVLAPSADYAFHPVQNKNTVTIPVEGQGRYLKLVFTANTEATAGQIGELEVFGE
ncbi:discoidin domain-containing protein [Spirochaeta thermophila]|uniref:F5/8 type C domain-containing protein n=1 Tax=Winmispira thermophila (strain ATCC 49972 / DSM 6192 / RI 19.B1) TaxID=665571 RepID=E0RTU2_WINT6|nr:discoidin domain-containing protein [Spirochaeta thermophila]ADN02467.1 hypothetical protein STHERM_c15270 [Spirochaeta thermophila DSM 6192]